MRYVSFQLILFLFVIPLGFSQEYQRIHRSVENGLYGVNISPTTIYLFGEHRLADEIALISSVGVGDINLLTFDPSGDEYSNGFLLVLEPRWYYSISNRVYKDKNINGNSSNFLSVQIAIPITDDSEPALASYVNWGIRRTLGSSSNFYLGIHVGLGVHSRAQSIVVPNFNIKLGYFIKR